LRNPNRQTSQPNRKMRAVSVILEHQLYAPLPRERLRPPTIHVKRPFEQWLPKVVDVAAVEVAQA
jgi:hypothetical protein